VFNENHKGFARTKDTKAMWKWGLVGRVLGDQPPGRGKWETRT